MAEEAGAGGLFVLSAEDPAGNVWVVKTDTADAAAHVADLFRLSDHVRVTITTPDAPRDVD